MKNHQIFILSFIIISLSGCSPSKMIDEIRLKFNPPPRFIFGAEDVDKWVADIQTGLCNDQLDCPHYERNQAIKYLGLPKDAESFWKPSESDIERFEQELEKGFKKAQKTHSYDPPGSFWKYTIQYVGYIQKGQKIILAQGVQCYSPDDCPDLSDNWTMIFDGGTDVFSATFNTESGTFNGPWFNGYA